MNNIQEKKLKITTGIIRWWRFPFAFIAIIFFFEAAKFETYWHYYFLVFLIFGGLYYLLWNRRRLSHTRKYLYILNGKTEKEVPLANIVSIKRSRTKVNGSRYWILIYLDEIKQERKLRFDADFNKPFFDAVRANNPEVIIWEHPFFNH